MRTSYNMTSLPFVANRASLVYGDGIQIDWDTVTEAYRSIPQYTIQINDAAASSTDTTVGVDALPVALPAGTVLWFAAGKFLRTTLAAAKGATSLTTEALVANIADDAQAKYTGTPSGTKQIPAGTVMCRLASKMCVPRAIRPGSETAIGLLATDASQDDMSAAKSGFGLLLGGAVYENLLPDFSNGSWATFKSEMQTAGVGTGFAFLTYEDTRGS